MSDKARVMAWVQAAWNCGIACALPETYADGNEEFNKIINNIKKYYAEKPKKRRKING